MLNIIMDTPGWCSVLFLLLSISIVIALPADHRNIENGRLIPTEGYADQPFIVKTDDNAWLCAVTTGRGEEGETGQHIISTRSTDFGLTWEKPVDVEPSDGPEASYSVLFKTTSGRIFIFYNHNTDNVRRVKADNPPFKDGWCYRVDSQGYFVFKFSDDQGRSWSARRFPIPMRLMDIDRENPYGGEILYFWNVGKPFSYQGSVYVPLCKVGGLGHGFFSRNEGVLLKSDNLSTELEPEQIRWETLPDGEAGLRTPPGGGPIAGEHSYAVLSDGSFYAVYRSIDGHPVCAYSRDGGHSWSEPQYQSYADGRKMRHPRAANFIWKCSNGKYLYWFHNHGGNGYDDRNPAWLCGGVEVDAPEGKIIHWSQPEIVLYDDDPLIRLSYPDFIEEDGRYFISETQKEKARIHELDPALLQTLWGQFESTQVTREGLVLELNENLPEQVAMPKIPYFTFKDRERLDQASKSTRSGFSIDIKFTLTEWMPGQILLQNRLPNGQGFSLQISQRRTVEIVLSDGRRENRWDTDPGTVVLGEEQHLTAIIDGGPRIILFIVNGKLCDGANSRQFGWGRFSRDLLHVNGADSLQLSSDLELLRIYNRAIRVSEAVGNFRASI